VAQPRHRYGTYARLLRYLERHADLDRALEGLPDDDELSERLRTGQGLSRPELAIVEAYTKLGLYHGLLNSDLPADPDTYHLLVGYFPAGVAQFTDAIKAHRLRREIISTVLANQIAHSLDFNFPRRISEQSGRDVPDLARAFLVASAVFDIERLRERIDELENRVPAAIQTEMTRDLSSLIERASFWLLRNREQPLAISKTTAEFAHHAKALTGRLDQLVSGWERRRHRTRARELRAAGVPEDLAAVVARTASLFSILDIVDISNTTGVDTEFTARVYFEIGRHFQMPWLREQIATLPAESHWQGVAKSGLYTDLYRCQNLLAQAALAHNALRTPKGRIARWARARAARVARAGEIITDVRTNESPDLATLMVVIREIEMLIA